MGGPPKHQPTLACVVIKDIGGTNGFIWFVYHGNMIASSAGTGYLATRDEAVQHFEKFRRRVTGAEIIA